MHSSLRTFFAGLASSSAYSESSRIPDELRRLAWQAMSHHHLGDVDDVVGAFLLRILEAERLRAPGGVTALLKLDDQSLIRILRHRLRQSAVGCGDTRRWELLKALRAHVKRCLQLEQHPSPDMPLSLLKNGRLSNELVHQSVSAVLLGDYPPPRSVRAIAGELMDIYFPAATENVLDNLAYDALNPEDEVRLDMDAETTAAEVHASLGADAGLLARRADGDTLATIAALSGTAASTTHSRLKSAESHLARVLRDSSPSTRLRTLRVLIQTAPK